MPILYNFQEENRISYYIGYVDFPEFPSYTKVQSTLIISDLEGRVKTMPKLLLQFTIMYYILQKTKKGKLKHITVSLIKLAVISRVDCTFYTL